VPQETRSRSTKSTARATVANGKSRDESVDPLQETAQRYHAELPWADPDTIEVNLAIFRAHRVMGASLARHLDSAGLGITRARYTVLRTLYFAEGNRMPQNEIGREMGVSKTNITNLIDGLERDSLVVRMTNPVDRRVTYAQLTPAGVDLCRDLMPAMTQWMTNLLRDFTPEERRQFKDFLSRIWREVESEGVEAAPEAD
jgi:MarR family 2-MHQ and catechol resistance regulon transcriptional repressor